MSLTNTMSHIELVTVGSPDTNGCAEAPVANATETSVSPLSDVESTTQKDPVSDDESTSQDDDLDVESTTQDDEPIDLTLPVLPSKIANGFLMPGYGLSASAEAVSKAVKLSAGFKIADQFIRLLVLVSSTFVTNSKKMPKEEKAKKGQFNGESKEIFCEVSTRLRARLVFSVLRLFRPELNLAPFGKKFGDMKEDQFVAWCSALANIQNANESMEKDAIAKSLPNFSDYFAYKPAKESDSPVKVHVKTDKKNPKAAKSEGPSSSVKPCRVRKLSEFLKSKALLGETNPELSGEDVANILAIISGLTGTALPTLADKLDKFVPYAERPKTEEDVKEPRSYAPHTSKGPKSDGRPTRREKPG